MKSPITTSLHKQTPINKKAIPYMTANKTTFTYMKKYLKLLFCLFLSYGYSQELTIPTFTQYLGDNPAIISPAYMGIGDFVKTKIFRLMDDWGNVQVLEHLPTMIKTETLTKKEQSYHLRII